MKFGIFYEHQIPRPWNEQSEHRLLHESLDQIELADRLGYDYAWLVEHHFMEEYSHCTAPEVFLGAASQRTRNIRLGHGIIQLPTNHPARVAERVSTLDLLSNGRVEFGMGEGSSVTELHPFGRRFRDKRAVFEDAVRAIMPMFTSEAWEYHGEYFDFPLRNVIPKPLQKPHPPLWVACSQLDTIVKAGQWGMGVLGFSFVNAEAARAWVHAYYDAYTKHLAKLTEYVTNPQVAIVSAFVCCETDEEAQAKADGWTFFLFCLIFYNTHGPVVPGSLTLWDEYQKWKNTPPGRKARGMGAHSLIGSPETIRQRLAAFEATHIDQVILLNQTGKNTHEEITSSLELFAREVMPEFQERDSAHQEWKQAVIAGDLELEEIDLAPHEYRSTQTPTADRLESKPRSQRKPRLYDLD